MRRHITIAAALAVALLAGCTAMYKADREMEQAHYAQAIPLYQEYLRRHPESIEAQRNLGLAHLRSGQVDAAATAFNAVLAKRRNDAYAHLYLGVAQLYQGDMAAGMASMGRFDAPSQPQVGDEIKYQLSQLRTKLAGGTPTAAQAQALARETDAAIAAAVQRQKEADRLAAEQDIGGGGGGGAGGGCGC